MSSQSSINFQKLAYEDLLNIAKNLPIIDLLNLCETNSILYNICNDDFFWRDLIIRDYPFYKLNNQELYKDQYINLYEDYNYFVNNYPIITQLSLEFILNSLRIIKNIEPEPEELDEIFDNIVTELDKLDFIDVVATYKIIRDLAFVEYHIKSRINRLFLETINYKHVQEQLSSLAKLYDNEINFSSLIDTSPENIRVLIYMFDRSVSNFKKYLPMLSIRDVRSFIWYLYSIGIDEKNKVYQLGKNINESYIMQRGYNTFKHPTFYYSYLSLCNNFP